MAGKAKTRKTYGRKLKDQTVDIQKLYAMAGAKSTPQASTMSFAGGQSSSTPDTIDEFQRLKTSGDTMIGAIAYLPKITQIDGNGAIDLQPSDVLGSTSDDYTSYLLVTPVGSADDLKTISNASAGGQILHLEANTTGTITLKHNTGNIFIPSTNDHIIEAGGFATLIFDEVIHANKWVLVSSSKGGSSSWVGTATTDLDMADNDIDNVAELEFNNSATPTTTSMAISALSNSMYYNVPSNDSHYFQLGGTTKFEVNDVIDTRRNDVVNIKRAIFDEDDDTFIAGEHYSSIADDTLEFFTGDSLRFKIDNTTTTATGQFSSYGNTILCLSSSETLAINGRLTTSLIPNSDNAVDLGSSTKEWKDLYLDGIAYIDTVSAGTISVTTFSTTGTSNLGDGDTDQVNFYGKTDWKTNVTSSSATTGSREGYITIKINGTDKKLYYYS